MKTKEQAIVYSSFSVEVESLMPTDPVGNPSLSHSEVFFAAFCFLENLRWEGCAA